MTIDPIADLLTRVRNAIKAKHISVDMPTSKEKNALVSVMKDNGFIKDYEITPTSTNQSHLKIFLKYTSGVPAILELQRVSKPGLRKYFKCEELPEVLNGLGIAVVSTSKGIMSNKQAKKIGVGGEVLCFIY